MCRLYCLNQGCINTSITEAFCVDHMEREREDEQTKVKLLLHLTIHQTSIHPFNHPSNDSPIQQTMHPSIHFNYPSTPLNNEPYLSIHPPIHPTTGQSLYPPYSPDHPAVQLSNSPSTPLLTHLVWYVVQLELLCNILLWRHHLVGLALVIVHRAAIFGLCHFSHFSPSHHTSCMQPPLCLQLAAPFFIFIFLTGTSLHSVFEITPLGPAGVSLVQTQLGKTENGIVASQVTLLSLHGSVLDVSSTLSSLIPPHPLPLLPYSTRAAVRSNLFSHFAACFFSQN